MPPGDSGFAVVELAAYLDRPADPVSTVLDLQAGRSLIAVAIDPHSHAATLIKPLREAGVPMTELSTSDVVVAHGDFLDELNAGRLRHVSHPQLDAAVRHGMQRPLGGASTWERRGDLRSCVCARRVSGRNACPNRSDTQGFEDDERPDPVLARRRAESLSTR
jgi:hypothetical protein